jgi:pyruvate/2-oxoglutarate dehydrogenase complex dihydrolipoamide acyltransferase (E2) component
MPQLAQSVVEGEVARWLIKEGDAIQIDQIIAEITCDKVDVELPAPVAGVVLKIMVAAGNTVPVGTPLAYIGRQGESVDASAATSSATFSALTASILGIDKAHETAVATSVAPAPTADRSSVRAVPVVRKLAQEMGVDLATVHGRGPGGRITKEDVLQAAALPNVPAAIKDRIEYLPFSGRRKQIAQRLAHCKSVVPHASCMEEIDFGELAEIRKGHKATAAAHGVNLTYLPYVVVATVHALTRHPLLNSTLEEAENRIAVKHYCNIGIAVDAPEGLVVPVVRNAGEKGLLEIAQEIQSLSTRAREDRLDPDDVRDSTFTISSVGGQAGLFSVGILNYPEVALLNLHRIQSRPAVVNDQLTIRPMAYVTLTFDHRVFDGGEVVRFLGDLKQRLEEPGSWANL